MTAIGHNVRPLLAALGQIVDGLSARPLGDVEHGPLLGIAAAFHRIHANATELRVEHDHRRPTASCLPSPPALDLRTTRPQVLQREPISNPAASKHSEPGSGTAAIVSRVTNMRSPPPNRPMTDKSVGDRIHGISVRLPSN